MAAEQGCPWPISPQSDRCGDAKEPGSGYCREHRREYQRNRRTSGAQKTKGASVEDNAKCYACNKLLARGVRREPIHGREWCGYCLNVVEYVTASSPETRRRIDALIKARVELDEQGALVDKLSAYVQDRSI